MIPGWMAHTFNAPLFPLGEQSISLAWLLQVAALLVVVSLLARAIKGLLRERLLLWLQLPEGRREAIATVCGLGSAALGYVLVVQGMGLDFGAIAVIVGALGVGLGFGLQDLTRNLSSGLTLLMEGKLKVGDLIEFNQMQGFIKEISIRSTVVRTFQGSEIIVPNTFITNNPVQNLSYSMTDGRVEVPVVVAHGSDVLDVTEVLLQAALDEPFVNADPPPRVVFASQGEPGLSFLLWAWTSDIQNALLIRSNLNYAIDQGLRERGIELASPRRLIELIGSASAPLEQNPDGRDLVKREPSQLRPLSDVLPALPHFQGLRGRPLRELIASGARFSLRTGDILIRQGELGHNFNIVVSGCIDAIYETDRISRRLFSFRQGEFFGELPLLLEVPYPTTMRAAEDTTLFVIPRGGFRALLQRHPAFAEIITEEVSRRQEVLDSYEESLRARGFLANQDLNNPLQWFRDQMRNLLRN
jgi:potassium-dependent mechanosensitive channel